MGEPVGDPVGVGVGEGVGVGRTAGPIVCPTFDATGKFSIGLSCIADSMKSCQIAAGIVPPYTDGTPITLVSGTSPLGHPIQTQVVS